MRRRCLSEDEGARRGAAAAGGGPVEGRQVRGRHRAGAEDAQIHGAQHHRQVQTQQHGGKPATERATKETLKGGGGGGGDETCTILECKTKTEQEGGSDGNLNVQGQSKFQK